MNVEKLIKKREFFRKNNDFIEADKIRDLLHKNGNPIHRTRGKWKEWVLLSYLNGAQMTGHKFNSWQRFPFDVVAQEVIGVDAEPYTLENRIKEIWGE